MPKDRRTYITVHDGMPDHPKIDGLSDGAFRLLIESWCWCAKHQTNGKMSCSVWSKRGSAKTRAELVAMGLAEVDDVGDVYWHDYLEHQQSADERVRSYQQKVDAGRKGGLAKALAASSKPLAPASVLLEQDASGCSSKPLLELEVEVEIEKPPTGLRTARAGATEIGNRLLDGYEAHFGRSPRKSLNAIGVAIDEIVNEDIFTEVEIIGGLRMMVDAGVGPGLLAEMVRRAKTRPVAPEPPRRDQFWLA